MKKSSPIQRGVSQSPSFIGYVGTIAAERLEKMVSYTPAVSLGEDPEAIHQMRVWARRTRASLAVLDSVIGSRELTAVERIVKSAADSIGLARDLDVMIANLNKRIEGLPEPQRDGVVRFRDSLVVKRKSIQEIVFLSMGALKRQKPLERLRKILGRRAGLVFESEAA